MAGKKGGLGKGLGALIPAKTVENAPVKEKTVKAEPPKQSAEKAAAPAEEKIRNARKNFKGRTKPQSASQAV